MKYITKVAFLCRKDELRHHKNPLEIISSILARCYANSSFFLIETYMCVEENNHIFKEKHNMETV